MRYYCTSVGSSNDLHFYAYSETNKKHPILISTNLVINRRLYLDFWSCLARSLKNKRYICINGQGINSRDNWNHMDVHPISKFKDSLNKFGCFFCNWLCINFLPYFNVEYLSCWHRLNSYQCWSMVNVSSKDAIILPEHTAQLKHVLWTFSLMCWLL